MTQFIKSIQQAFVTAVGTPYTLPVAVDLTKSMIIYNGATTSNTTNTNYWNQIGRWSFDDNQHVRFTKDVGSATTFNARATVVEFNSDVISNQSGVITISAGALSAQAVLSTAVAVFPTVGATAFVVWEGVQTTAGSGGFSDCYGVALELTDSTHVTAKLGYTLGADIKVAWRVIELSSNIVSHVEPLIGATSNTGLTAYTYALGSGFVGNQSLFFPNGMTFASVVASGTPTSYRMEFIPTTTVSFTRATTNSVSKTIYGFMVEFQAAALSGNVQRNTIPGDGATNSPTAAITSADPTMSWVQWSGESTNAANNVGMFNIQQSSATLLTAGTQSSPSGATAILAWQVITFDNTPVVGGSAVGEGLTNSVLLRGGAGGRKLAA